MVEVIGFSLVGFMVLGIIIGIRKLFGRKKKLFDEEEIILDSKMMHFGPFSGSFMYTHRTVSYTHLTLPTSDLV